MLIGLFDSGLGGLSVLKELRRLQPGSDFIYLGDNARNPWGSRDRDTIIGYSRECTRFLLMKGADIVVVACSTATCAALEDLQGLFDCPIFGTVSGSAMEAAAAGARRVGLIGTRATLQSGMFQAELRRQKVHEIFEAPCPLFVPLIEEGITDGKVCHEIINFHMEELRSKAPEVLLLGCTHYSFLRGEIGAYFGKAVKIVDCSIAQAGEVSEFLVEKEKAVNGEAGREAADEASGRGGLKLFLSDTRGNIPVAVRDLLEEKNIDVIKVENLAEDE